MSKTAVDYLFQKLWTFPRDKWIWQHYLEKAKQMEKEQIIEAYDAGVWEVGCRNADSKQYYEETYGKDA